MKYIKYVLISLVILGLAAAPLGCKKAPVADEANQEEANKPQKKSKEQLESEALQREEMQQKEAESQAAKNEAESTNNQQQNSGLPGGAAQQAPDMSKIAVIETNKGVIKFGFFPDKAPKTVENFSKLANDGFFNGIKWHRVVTGFVIQGGDPNSRDADPSNDGLGGPGYKIDAEFSDLKHLDGTVAMARAQDINSAGSQFYICMGPQQNLDNNYTIFGQVIEGLDVVYKIQVGDTMNKVTIETK